MLMWLLSKKAAAPPAWAHDFWKIACVPKPQRSWGTAIATRIGMLHAWAPEATWPWLGELKGSAVVARLEHPDLWLASIHSHHERLTLPAMAHSIHGIPLCDSPHINEIDLIAHEFRGLAAGEPFIFGGDLNTAVHLDPSKRGGARLLKNLVDGGFEDLRGSGPRQQTFFKQGSCQIDHVFADATTATRPHSWVVRTDVATVLRLSDHAPIVIEFADSPSMASKTAACPERGSNRIASLIPEVGMPAYRPLSEVPVDTRTGDTDRSADLHCERGPLHS